MSLENKDMSTIEESDIVDGENIVDEKRKRDVFDSIYSKESGELDISSFDNLPYLFCGLDTSSFGSTLKDKNPFFTIKGIAMDDSQSWNDRTTAVRYMQRIPHKDRYSNCIEATKSIVSDKKYSFRDRYHFFSNNERLIKLDYEIVNALHVYIYEMKDTVEMVPVIYKILSAQHILTQFPIGTYDIDGVQRFLQGIGMNENEQIVYRAECADILSRVGYGNYKQIGDDIISKLGDLYNENKSMTIYSNLQNVHDNSINASIVESLRNLLSSTTVNEERHTGEIYEYIVSKKSQYDSEYIDKVVESLQRIVIDTSRYEGYTIHDILLCVWQKIIDSPHKDEMCKRLIDELYDMYSTCSTGHLSRIINCLSGFIDSGVKVSISVEDQLKSNIFSRYTSLLRTLSEDVRDDLVNEMSSNDRDKPLVGEFIFSYSLYDELFEEFVPEYLDSESFKKLYYLYENTFFNKKE